MGLKSTLGALALSAAVLFGQGCAATSRKPVWWDQREKVYPAVEARMGLDYVYYRTKLPHQIETTPVHPDDAGFLTGETRADVDSGYDIAPKLGLGASLGGENLRLIVGGDVRYNPGATTSDDDSDAYNFTWEYGDGIYQRKQQASDTRSMDSGSFVFTSFDPEGVTYVPSVGIEATFFKKIRLGIEAGLPYSRFKVRSGHDRFRRWQTVQKDSWTGYGESFGASIGCIDDNPSDAKRSSISLSVRQERYEPRFAGERAEIDSFVILLQGIIEY